MSGFQTKQMIGINTPKNLKKLLKKYGNFVRKIKFTWRVQVVDDCFFEPRFLSFFYQKSVI